MEILIPITAMMTGLVISLAFFYAIYRMVKLFADRKSGKRLPNDVSNRLNEMEQNYQYLEKRIRNLEAITTEDDFTPSDITTGNTSGSPTGTAANTTGKKRLENTLRNKS